LKLWTIEIPSPSAPSWLRREHASAPRGTSNILTNKRGVVARGEVLGAITVAGHFLDHLCTDHRC